MKKDEVFTLVKQEILKVLPLVNEQQIVAEKRLVDLGANSIDRSEIVINCMTILNVKLEPMTLASLKNIGELWEALYQTINK